MTLQTTRLAALLLLLAIPPALANSGLEYVLITPACILGMDNERTVKACAERVPELAERLHADHAAWKRRNAEALGRLSAHCERGLATLYRDLGLDAEAVKQVRAAADRLMEKMRQSMREQTPAQCTHLTRALAEHTLTAEEVAQSTGIPLTLAFMQHVDPQLLREPPRGVAANYQRDRELHYAQAYGRFAALRTGTASLEASCLGHTVAACQRAHGDTIGPAGELAHRERLPGGEEKLTYVGTKMLFQGAFSDNHPAGREERVFVLDDEGRIKAAWDRVQLLEPGVAAGSSRPLCERYGRPDTSTCHILSVE